MDKEIKKRTLRQNAALHLYFTKLAKELNDAGLDMKAVLKPEVDIPWSKQSIKEFIWKPIQEVYLGERSTTKLGTKDIDKIYDTITRHLGEKFGISVMFPSLEEVLFNEKNVVSHHNKIKEKQV